MRGAISTKTLYSSYKYEAEAAVKEARLVGLGPKSRKMTEQMVRAACRSVSGPWILTAGGPPCQAYSLAGRSRMRGVDPTAFEKDARHFLYREYLHILREFQPTAFVFENVRGLLSSTVSNKLVLHKLMADFEKLGYSLYSFRLGTDDHPSRQTFY